MEKIIESHKNNKFKILAATWNDRFELPERSYSISDIQDYQTLTHNQTIKIYIDKVENKIKFKIKSGNYIGLWNYLKALKMIYLKIKMAKIYSI